MIKRIALLLPIMSGILFGSAGVFIRKLGEFGMDNMTILFSRVFFAILILFIGILVYDRNLFRIRLRDLPVFIGSGLLGMLGINLCYTEAINYLTLSLAAVLLSTAPVFVMLMAAVIFKERITRRKLVCMLLAIAGCAMATGIFDQTVSFSAKGVVLGVLSAIFYALYSICSRIATDRGYHTFTIIFYSVLMLLIVLAPFADIGQLVDFAAQAPAAHMTFYISHSLFTSVLPYVFLTLALMYAEAGIVSILASGGEPVSAVVFGMIFYEEMPTPLAAVGMAVTIAALAALCLAPGKQ